MTPSCPFCTLPRERILHENAHAIAIRDAYPVSPGHTLIIPRRHVQSFFDTTAEEKQDLLELLALARGQIFSSDPSFTSSPQPSFNIGINDGAAAGQTVPHLHIHLIPRYEGDVEDPRGGVRWVIPEKAKYW
jgi:diadenosine tetraphosphate (Ap4A) HIT family hydrolase